MDRAPFAPTLHRPSALLGRQIARRGSVRDGPPGKYSRSDSGSRRRRRQQHAGACAGRAVRQRQTTRRYPAFSSRPPVARSSIRRPVSAAPNRLYAGRSRSRPRVTSQRWFPRVPRAPVEPGSRPEPCLAHHATRAGRATSFPLPVRASSLAWSPDGKRLLLSASRGSAPHRSLRRRRKRHGT